MQSVVRTSSSFSSRCPGTDEGAQLVRVRLAVGLAEFDELPDVVVLEQDETENVGALRLGRTESARKISHEGREPRLELGCEAAEVAGRADHENLDALHPVALALGQSLQQVVHALE